MYTQVQPYETTPPVMTGTTATTTESQSNDGSVTTVKTRFGEVRIDVAKAIAFPKGLLGMPDRQRYVLAEFPSANMRQFKLLQSLEDQSLSFITLPLELKNSIIAEADLKEAAQNLGIPVNEMAILLIVSVHRGVEGVRISVNARAPVLVHAGSKAGAQYVFSYDKYKVQHMLS